MSNLTDPVFQTGGALRANSKVYIERTAETEAVQQLRRMNYLKIIEPRQQGKSSLINWLSGNLRIAGYSFTVVDMSTLEEFSEAAWYDNLSDRILKQVDFISNNDFINLPKTSRSWRDFLVVLANYADQAGRQVVIALDEIGTTYQAWAEAFFRVLRDVFNNRQNEPYFEHLTFILAGCYNPSRLIRQESESPFNIAVRIRLPDFSHDQVCQLVAQLQLPEEQTELITKRIHCWTDGQPYLTQLLCYYLSIQNQPFNQINIDNEVQKLIREDQNHLPPILATLRTKPDLGKYVKRVLNGYRAYFAPEADGRRHAQLELIGVVKADTQGYCIIRNPIYAEALTKDTDSEKSIATLSDEDFKEKERNSLVKQLRVWNDNRRLFEEQAAVYGISVPVDLRNNLENAKKQIAALEARIFALDDQ